MDMALPIVNATAAVLARVSAAFNAPFARAVVFGVHIDGKPLTSTSMRNLWCDKGDRHSVTFHFSGHLVVEGLLIAVIVFQLSRKSYKPPKKPLSEKVKLSSACSSLLLCVRVLVLVIAFQNLLVKVSILIFAGDWRAMWWMGARTSVSSDQGWGPNWHTNVGKVCMMVTF